MKKTKKYSKKVKSLNAKTGYKEFSTKIKKSMVFDAHSANDTTKCCATGTCS